MTVKELKEKLATLPDNAKVISAGPDCGGYDFEIGTLNVIVISPDKSMILLCHEDDPEIDWNELLSEHLL